MELTYDDIPIVFDTLSGVAEVNRRDVVPNALSSLITYKISRDTITPVGDPMELNVPVEISHSGHSALIRFDFKLRDKMLVKALLTILTEYQLSESTDELLAILLVTTTLDHPISVVLYSPFDFFYSQRADRLQVLLAFDLGDNYEMIQMIYDDTISLSKIRSSVRGEFFKESNMLDQEIQEISKEITDMDTETLSAVEDMMREAIEEDEEDDEE